MYVSIMCLPSLLRCQPTIDMSKLGLSHNKNAVRASLVITPYKRELLKLYKIKYMHRVFLQVKFMLSFSGFELKIDWQ